MISWYKKFCSQPHQPFFTNGIVFFILFMALFGLAFGSYINIDSSLYTYHAYALIFIVFIQFFLGFLFVVFPKFLMQAEIESKEYMKQFYLYFIASLGFFLSIIFYSKLIIYFQILMLFAQILSFVLLYKIHKKSTMPDKNDTKWILISFFTGLISHFIYIFSNIVTNYSYELLKISINSGFYLFLFMIVFTISQRMIPFFTRVMVPDYQINKSHYLLNIFFILLLIKVIILSFEDAKLNLFIDIPIFLFLLIELYKWKLPTFKTPAIVWILHLGIYWIVIAFFISIIESIFAYIYPNIYFEKIVIHTLALGYFVTVLIGFGTRVILGHSGRKIETKLFAKLIFIFLQIFVLLRIFSSISMDFGLSYTVFIELSTIIFIVLLLVWSLKYIVILIEPEKKIEKKSKWSI
ncbi:NnrS family protein [Aliarcobacter thereius]|uniref:NnrS family protein n=2 Tax=Aliarcobacter thereius TaxID=544718 RepID=A0A1C0B7W9_9BACT|nr:NnrS family protein [Aliarcobacter thereius]OCL94022.1 NnrS protein [Aliarcobacter thereius]OCL95416.1 NnrS protein [Aliarcobacter thereius LMG 24486]OCL99690.1 NnrS protein [Aliarcobacter thereius]QBF16596.1 putative heme-copper protein NnrS [Aliarcobacter thereius LMG 24486]TLS73060.1 NnrS family protein [Aliarcobacter thereius]